MEEPSLRVQSRRAGVVGHPDFSTERGQAVERGLAIDWDPADLPEPAFTGTRQLDDISLAEIRRLLGRPRKELAAALERQLFELSTEIEALRDRQRIIVGLLKKPRLLERAGVMTRETWTELLRASGFTEEDMRRWHRDFERLEPRRHQRFLAFLGIPPGEIRRIRAWARTRS